jgi:hypothetical protein
VLAGAGGDEDDPEPLPVVGLKRPDTVGVALDAFVWSGATNRRFESFVTI